MGKRPKLRIPLSAFEFIIQAISAIGVLMMLLTLYISWGDIPKKMPTHFDPLGRVTSWGGKGTLIFLAIVVIGLYILLSLVERFPHVYNYLCEITEENARFQYKNARLMLSCLKLEIVLLFGYIEWTIVQVALSRSTGLGISFLPIFLIVLFGTVGVFTYRMVKHK